MRYLNLFSLVLGLISLFAFSSCDESSLMDGSSENARLEVRLIDGPADYEKVLVDIIDVQIKFDDGDWASLDMVNPDTYDLLELTAGVDALLGETELPSGHLKEVRLVLGDGNFLQIEGELVDLDTPSGQQSGLKVKVDETLEEGTSYILVLDFEAGKSIVEAGNSGKYILKPVIYAHLEAVEPEEETPTTGEIIGIITPTDEYYLELTPPMGDLKTTYSNDAGEFLFPDLEPGTYSLKILPPAMSAVSDSTIADIVVEAGVITDLMTIELVP